MAAAQKLVNQGTQNVPDCLIVLISVVRIQAGNGLSMEFVYQMVND